MASSVTGSEMLNVMDKVSSQFVRSKAIDIVFWELPLKKGSFKLPVGRIDFGNFLLSIGKWTTICYLLKITYNYIGLYLKIQQFYKIV